MSYQTTRYLRTTPEGQERIHAKLSEFPEATRARPTHQLNIAAGQLERRRLEPEIAAGAVGQDEPEINVNNVAVSIQQDISVVPVSASGKEDQWGWGRERGHSWHACGGGRMY